MPRDRWPDEVDLIYDDFNTEVQEETTRVLLEEWGPNISMTDVADLRERGRTHVQDCRDRFLGPPNSGMSFEEVKADFGSVGDYLDLLERGEILPSGEQNPNAEVPEKVKAIAEEIEAVGPISSEQMLVFYQGYRFRDELEKADLI